VVATSWPIAERVRLESEFRKWAAQSKLDLGEQPINLKWLILTPGDDLARVASRRNPPDVLLGGSAGAFDRLARAGRLSPLPGQRAAYWCIARPSTFRLVDGSPLSEPGHETAGLGDPRTDPARLVWAMSQLKPGHWREGYARLVETAGHARSIGLLAGANPRTLAASDRDRPPASGSSECAGILRLARDQAAASEFLRFLIESRQFDVASNRGVINDAPDPGVASLVADLLGATLVDAQDELWAAWGALKRAGNPGPAHRWLTEPPAWPPASIEKYLRREGENAMSLIETLAAELAPDAVVRGWLIRSWLAPPRPVDEALLSELARAVEGRLSREQRFRSWLRAEWTAWARQRYRRVARLAATTQSNFSAQ
jgi:hypothetical protein